MKQISNFGKYISTLVLSFVTLAVAFAQGDFNDTDLEIETTAIGSGPFYAQLWFWIVIGMVFLLILIALVRGNGGKTEVAEE